MLLTIAFRNIFRNKRRTTITLAAVIFGCAALIINGGLIFFIFDQLRDAAIYGYYGHFQIYKKGYVEKHMAYPMEYVIAHRDYEDLKPVLLHDIGHVKDVTARLEFFALANNNDKTVSFIGLGVEPGKDEEFSRHTPSRDNNVDLTQLTILQGQGLAKDEPLGVILGQGLSARMEARVGDYITLLTNTPGGAINALDVRVRGIFASGWKEVDEWLVRIPLQTAQQLAQVDAVHSVILLLDHTENTEAVHKTLNAFIGKRNLNLELRAWSDLAVFYHQVVTMFGRELNIIKFIVAAIVVLSIINTMTMSVFERTSEIGTLMAIGTKRKDILSMFLLEALILGIWGGMLGIASGVVLAKVISYIGIPMPPPPSATHGFVARVHIVVGVLFYSFFIAVISTVIAGFYPAFKASRLKIIDALRHV